VGRWGGAGVAVAEEGVGSGDYDVGYWYAITLVLTPSGRENACAAPYCYSYNSTSKDLELHFSSVFLCLLDF
jgi:hypothetical protein